MTAGSTNILHASDASTTVITRTQRVRLGRILLGVLLLVVWHWGAVSLGPDLLATPLAVAVRVQAMVLSREFYGHVLVTSGEALGGLLIGGVAGIAAPLLLRFSPRLTDALLPYLRAAMGIPKLALTPVLILWFGLGIPSKIVLIALITFFMMFEATYAGLQSVEQRLVRMIRILGASEAQITREIILNSILPFIFAAFKTALPWSVSAAVVGEFLASEAGLGYLINFARDIGDVTGVCAGVAIVTALVLALDLGLSRLQTRSLRWQAIDSRVSL